MCQIILGLHLQPTEARLRYFGPNLQTLGTLRFSVRVTCGRCSMKVSAILGNPMGIGIKGEIADGGSRIPARTAPGLSRLPPMCGCPPDGSGLGTSGGIAVLWKIEKFPIFLSGLAWNVLSTPVFCPHFCQPWICQRPTYPSMSPGGLPP